MTDRASRSPSAYRDRIAGDLTPVRPLPAPWRRVGMVLPLGVLLATIAPIVLGGRRDLDAHFPLLTWGATGVQTMLGLWLLALGFREAVPGQNASRRALAVASILTVLLIVVIALLTDAV